TTSTFTVEDTTAPVFVDTDCDTTVELDFDPNNGPGDKDGFTYLGEYEGHYYYITTETMSATDGNILVGNNGGYMATITDADENQWIYDAAVASNGGNNIRFWIGLTDVAEEGVFLWMDGTTFDYENWHNGEPNNRNGNEHCVELGRFNSSTWNDEPCTNQKYILMEVDGASLKEEAAYTDACAGDGTVTDYSDVLTEIQGGNSTMLFSTVYWLITMNLSGVDQNGYDYYDGTIDNSPSGYFTYTLTFNTNSGQWELNEYYDYGNTFNFTVFTSDSQETSPPCDISEYFAGSIAGQGTEQLSCQGSSVVEYNLARTFVATDGCNSTECTINYTWTVDEGPAPTNPAPGGENGVGAGIQSQAQANDTTVDSMVELDFTAFPVPFDSVVSVKFNFEFDTDVTIEVHDTRGLLVKSMTLNNVRANTEIKKSFDLSRAGDQLFYITVTTNQGSVTKKAVSSNMKRR
ncbi:lectin-like protein, partial [Flavobacteriaceae bacterium]|nr:lectin-like protein [Flavobacteriaceae bacterium]